MTTPHLSSEWAAHAQTPGNTPVPTSRRQIKSAILLYNLQESQSQVQLRVKTPNLLGGKVAHTLDPSTREGVCESKTSQAYMGETLSQKQNNLNCSLRIFSEPHHRVTAAHTRQTSA